MGKCLVSSDLNRISVGLNPCFGGFGWERGRRVPSYHIYGERLNPCFGGFGWERVRQERLVWLLFCLNPCFGGFGWESGTDCYELIEFAPQS